MSSSASPPAKGTYAPSTASDLRSPCPLINCLANHGYISRDGRNVHADALTRAMYEVGLSAGLGAVFANPIFLEHQVALRPAERGATASTTPPKSRSFLGYLGYLLRNQWALLFSAFAMRRPGQTDAAGRRSLDLDQLALPGVVEHDISLTRRDHQQGDNLSRQPDLVRDLLAASSDGTTLTAADLAALRRRRIEKQKEVNPGLTYGPQQHQVGCTEIALVLDVFGDGKQVPCEYARAFFQDERLPRQEGWKKRRWWMLGFLELGRTVGKVKELVGVKV